MRIGNLRRRPATSNVEQGYFLVVIMVAVSMLAIASLAHVQDVATQLKRDREEEMIHRGAQYARAVQKFVRKFKQYPVRLEQLENTNNIRCLRKRYKDPITGGDFRLVRQAELVSGQNASGGLFGNQAAGGATGGAAGGSLTSPIASGLFGAAGLGPQSPATSTFGTGAQSPSSSPFGQSPTGPSSLGPSKSTSSDSNFGSSGPVLGGGPFIGVASTSDKVSLKVFDGKNHYKDWAFIYLPQLDRPGANGSTALIKGPFVRSQLTNGAFGGGITNLNGSSSNSGNSSTGIGGNSGASGNPSTSPISK